MTWRAAGFKADSLHGDLNQARREQVLARFRDHSVTLLVGHGRGERGGSELSPGFLMSSIMMFLKTLRIMFTVLDVPGGQGKKGWRSPCSPRVNAAGRLKFKRIPGSR